MSSTVTMASSMLPSIGEEEDVFESASVRILPATPAQVVPVAAAASSGGVKTYISVYNGEGRVSRTLCHARFCSFLDEFSKQVKEVATHGCIMQCFGFLASGIMVKFPPYS